MMKQNRIRLVSIILPTYNEAENIVDLIKALNSVVESKREILIIDDDSPDGTSRVVQNYITSQKKNGSRIFLKTRHANRGLTNSIREGISMAKGDVVVWMDCDFSMPPSVVPSLLKKIEEGYDVAVGSRFVPGGKIKETSDAKQDSPLAIILSRLMNSTIQLLLAEPFKDYTSGFIAVRKKVLNRISLRGDYGEYFIDLIYKAFAYNYKIVEVPYVCVSRQKGESKTGSNIWEYLNRGRKYLTLTFTLLFEKHLTHKIP